MRVGAFPVSTVDLTLRSGPRNIISMSEIEFVEQGRECRLCGCADRALMKTDKTKPSGHAKICKACHAATRDRAKEALAAKSPERRADSAARAKARRAADPERARRELAEWRAKNKEKTREYNARYHAADYVENGEKIRAQVRKYAAANRDLINARNSDVYRNDPAQRARIMANSAHQGRIRRTRLANARCVPATRAEIMALPDACEECGGPAQHLDHIFPVAHGGCAHIHNLRWLCAAHNMAKGAKLPQLGAGCPEMYELG